MEFKFWGRISSVEQLKKALQEWAEFIFRQYSGVVYINVGFILEDILSLYYGIEKFLGFRSPRCPGQLGKIIASINDFMRKYPDACLYRLVQSCGFFQIPDLNRLEEVTIRSREARYEHTLCYQCCEPLWRDPFESYYMTVYYERVFVLDSLVVCEGKVPPVLVDYIKSDLQYLAGYLMYRLAIRYALRSAVAAIMARNMSHLLGSHIEPGIQNDLISLVRTVSNSQLLNGNVQNLINNVAQQGWPSAFRWLTNQHEVLRDLYQIQQKALDRYALYRQRRMDFIARVATDWPAWGAGFDFYINFVRPFIANSVLLHFVGYSDGVHLDWLDFDVYIGGSKVTEQYTPPQDTEQHTPQQSQPIVLSPLDMAVSWGLVKSEGGARYPSRPDGYTPVTVWSRGGDMAIQAFHVILENIIRNSIKHCLPSIKSNKKLRIGIRLFQTYQELSGAVKCPEGLRLKASDDLVYVVISSDADCPNMAKELDQKICEPVIKETGEREPGNWGMKEIKIAAAFLGNRGLEEVNNPNPDFVQICKVQMPKENGQVVEQLGYCLTLPRFYYVGILEQGAGDVVSASA